MDLVMRLGKVGCEEEEENRVVLEAVAAIVLCG